MNTLLARLSATFLLALSLAGCVVYDPYYPYGPPPSGPSTFDRSWAAAVGALRDNGVTITSEDRSRGVIQGQRGNIRAGANVITQADGRVRVEFNTGGALSEDPGLPDRVSRSYDARMGR